MKIAIDARIMDKNSGIGRYLKNLLEQLQRLDITNQYVVILHSKNWDAWSPSVKNFQKVKANYRHFSIGEQLGFCRFLYKLKADVVHFPYVNHPLLYFRPKIINVLDFTLVDYKSPRGSKLIYFFKYVSFRIVMRRAIKSSNFIITISQYVRNQITERYKVPLSKIVNTYPAVDKLSAKPAAITSLVGKDFLLYVGSAYPYKNLQLLIGAFKQVSARRPGLHLVLAGKQDYFYKKLKDYALVNNVKNVHFSGFVDDKQLKWLYLNSKAYVFPSRSEGFGLPGLEAMQHNLPVLAAKASCLPEIYENAALYANPNSLQDWASKIDEILANVSLRQRLIRAGNKQASKFSWEELAKKTLELYRKI